MKTYAYCSACRRWFAWVKYPLHACPECGARLEER